MKTVLVALLLSYLTGGIPWSLLVVRWAKGIDLRQIGSGNLGASNVYRVLGAGGALGVLALDVAKGVVAPLVFARLRWDEPALAPAMLAIACGLAAIAGHVFPPYLRFRGGKGIATTAGVFAALEPRACAIAFGVFVLVMLFSRGIVSISSLAGSTALPIAVVAMGALRGSVAWAHAGAAAALAILIWIKHVPNLKRLRRGEEKSLFRRAGRPVT